MFLCCNRYFRTSQCQNLHL